MTTAPTQVRGNTERDRQKQQLVEYGHAVSLEIGAHVSDSKIRRTIRDNLARAGYDRTRERLRELAEEAARDQFPSYEKALKSSSIKNIAYVGKKNVPAPAATGTRTSHNG